MYKKINLRTDYVKYPAWLMFLKRICTYKIDSTVHILCILSTKFTKYKDDDLYLGSQILSTRFINHTV